MDAWNLELEADELARNTRWMRVLARELVGDPGAADDLTQRAWTLASRRGVPGGAPLRAFLARSLRLLALERLRGEGRRRAREEHAARAEAQTPTDELAERLEIQRVLVDEIAALDEPFRAALLRRYLADESPAEIARALGVPASTVRVRLHRGLAQLRERVERRLSGREAGALALVRLAGERAGDAPAAAALSAPLLIGGLAMKPLAITAAALAAVVALALWIERGPDDAGPHDADALAGGAAPLEGEPAAAPSELMSDAAPPAEHREEASAASPGAADRWLTGRVVGIPDPASPEVRVAAPNVAVELRLDGDTTTATTANDGSFAFPWPSASGGVEVVVAADERWREASAALDDSHGDGAELVIVRARHGDLTGRVVDPDGAPLGGALVLLGGYSDPEHEVETDAAGRFALRDATWQRVLGVGTPAHRLLSATTAREVETGGWEPIEVVCAPAGTLVVTVVDAAGHPLPDVPVAASLSAAEQQVAGVSGWFARPPSVRATTDGTGAALLERAWSGRALSLRVDARGLERVAERMHAGGELAFAPSEASAPIVVPLDGELTVVARVEAPFVLTGVVRRTHGPASEDVDGAQVIVRDQGIDGDEWERRVGSTLADADGAFAIELPIHALIGPLHVAAANDDAPRAAVELAMAEAVVELTADRRRRGGAHVELALAPTLAISGRIVDADGDPLPADARAFPGHVHVVPVGSGAPFHEASFGRPVYASVEPDGSFRARGLAPGTYDLFVATEVRAFFTCPVAFQRVASVAAGTEGLVVRLDVDLPVRAEVRLRAPGDAPVGGLLTVVRYEGVPDEGPIAAGAAHTARALTEWPRRLMLSFSGGSAWHTSRGSAFASTFKVRGPGPYTLPELGEGWYRFAVQPYAADGAPGFAPMATELLYLTGEIEVAFELVETGLVEGRVRVDGPATELRVALRGVDAHALPLLGKSGFGKGLVDSLEVAADGRFRIEGAPAGACELWVGTEGELVDGEPRARVALTVRAGTRSDGALLVEL